MRRTRFMSLVFLVLTLAFVCLPSFRQGYLLPYNMMEIDRSNHAGSGWLPGGAIDYNRWAAAAEAARDAPAMAFVAMHHPDRGAGTRLAEAATAADPKFTWIYFALANHLDEKDPQRVAFARKIQAWEPQNALGYLLEGQYLHNRDPKMNWIDVEVRAQQAEWRAVMEKAFAAPRYHTYLPERFQLDRTQFRSHGADSPVLMVLMVASAPVPNLLNIRHYQQLLAKFAQDEDKAGHLPEAMAYYWTSAHMGERMQVTQESLIEQLIGTALQRDSYLALAGVLRKQKQNDMAASLESLAEQIRLLRQAQAGRDDILAPSSNSAWDFFVVMVLAGLIGVFGVVSAVAVIYVNAKRWIRPDKKGMFYGALTAAENYAPIVLFVACACLYLSYYPYWINYEHYMTAAGNARSFEAFVNHTIPMPFYWSDPLPFGNPLVPYAWYALAGLLLVLIVHYVTRDKTQTPPHAKAAGA